MGTSGGHSRRSWQKVAAVAGTAALAGVFGIASPATASDSAVLAAGTEVVTGDAEVLEDHEVSIDGFAFIPQDLEIVAGDRVRWTNNQAGANHTVTDDAGGFGSPVLATGEMFEVEFPEPLPDPVNYHCEIHPFMTGTVTVTPPG